MSGDRRPRVRDRIRDSLRWRKPSASPSTMGAPLQGASPAPRSSTNSQNQHFLESALQKLTPSENEIIRRHLAPSTGDITSAVDQAYSAALRQKQICDGERWTWTFRGKKVVLRDEAEKMLHGFNKLKSIGDLAANVDPLHVGLPWAGIRVLLELSIAESRQMAALVVGMRLFFSTANRLEAYFSYFQHLPSTVTTGNLGKTLLDSYAHLLRFIASAIVTYERGLATRTWHALWETSAVEGFEKECDKLEARAERDASNCDRAMVEQDRTKTQQWWAELEVSLRKLDDIAKTRSAVNDLHDKFNLSQLQTELRAASAPGARYNSHADEHTAQCLAGTRVDLLAQIAAWVADPNGKNIFWLCGKAGTGKSTISRTVAESLKTQGLLGASFFFKQGEADRGNASRFFPTVVLQLIDVLPDMGRFVAEALDTDSGLCQSRLQDQHERLMLEPLLSATQHGQSSIKVVVIDALDECDNLQHARAILKLLAHENVVGGTPIRVFVTSRPEMPIHTGFKRIDGALHENIVLEEVQAASIEHDIRVYLRHRFQEIRDDRAETYDPLPAEWPGNDRIEALVSLAVPLFIFAFTVCRHVSQRDPQGRLDSLLRPARGTSLSGLNDMYSMILGRSLSDLPTDEHNRAIDDFRLVVGSIVMVANPLSATSLAKLLQVSLTVINDTLRSLHSVLYIPASPTSSIRLLHLSFRDFLSDQSLRSSSKFYINEGETHARLAWQCLRLLSQPGVLSNDLCKVSKPGARRADFRTDYVLEFLQPNGVYACSFWALHTIQSKQNLHDEDHVHEFLQKHFLHWLEALSWLGQISHAIGFVSELRSKATGSQVSAFLEDAYRFVLRNRYIINIAPLQAYHSALVFAPLESIIRRNFLHKESEHVRLFSGMPLKWSAEIQKLECHDSAVMAVCFSPDGSTLASGSDDCTVRLWNAQTGEEKQKLEGHNKPVMAVSFSPNGSLLASGSDDRTVRLWNAQTGEEIQKFEGHDESVNAIAISPNGKLLASASADLTVRIWDLIKGEETQKLEGHVKMPEPASEGGFVSSVAFSRDSNLLASACSKSDSTIRLWDVQSGEERLKLEGLDRDITGIQFSPDGTLYTGCLDYTIRLWNVSTGAEKQKLEGHQGSICSIAIDDASERLASTSYDGTVRLWDLITGEEKQVFEGHESIVTGVAFSPNGKLLASASVDSTIRLWDPASQKTQRSNGLNRDVRAVAFSPDGRLLASASYENKVSLWDAATGNKLQDLTESSPWLEWLAISPNSKLIATSSLSNLVRVWDAASGEEKVKIEGDEHEKHFATFSPDSKLLVSGQDEYTLRIWDVATGGMKLKLEGHCTIIKSVVFSPDGKRLACVSAPWCHTVQIWDTATGELRHQLEGTWMIDAVAFSPNGRLLATAEGTVSVWDITTDEERQKFGEHNDYVRTVAFSPDGLILASGSADGTVRVWDIKTGKEKQKLEGHHQQINTVAFSRDDKLLASGSNDQTIRVWDLMKGETTLEIREHESDVTSLAFSPDSKLLASTFRDNTALVFDVVTGEVVEKPRGHKDALMAVAFSPDGKLLTRATNDETMQIWETMMSENSMVEAVAFTSDGRQVASATKKKMLRIWDAKSGETHQKLEGHTGTVTTIRFSSDSKLLASASEDDTVRLWDVVTGEERQQVREFHKVKTLAFSPDRRLLASAFNDGTIRLRDVMTMGETQTLRGHDRWINALEFSPDSKLLVSASADQTLRVWVAKTGEERQKVQTGIVVKWLEFSADGLALRSNIGEFKLNITETAANGALILEAALEMGGEWLRCNGQDVLWLPHEYRGRGNRWTANGNTIATGLTSGAVAFFGIEGCARP